MDYIRELTDQINDYNEVLTYWIQLRQGDLSLHIESFPLQSLFDLLGRGRTSFQMKGIDLEVQPTEAVVKADKVLTLFMLNTLADNARKFTPKDGRVIVSARDLDDRVEIAVEDTGQGMTQDQLDHLFDNKPIIDPEGNQKAQSSKFSQVWPSQLQGHHREVPQGQPDFLRLFDGRHQHPRPRQPHQLHPPQGNHKNDNSFIYDLRIEYSSLC